MVTKQSVFDVRVVGSVTVLKSYTTPNMKLLQLFSHKPLVIRFLIKNDMFLIKNKYWRCISGR